MFILNLLVTLIMFTPPSNGARILMTPMQFRSHIIQFQSIAAGLIEQGHDVYMLLTPTNPAMIEEVRKTKTKVIQHHTPYKDLFTGAVGDVPTAMFDKQMTETPMDIIHSSSIYHYLPFCHNALSDDKLFDKIKDLKFDLGFVDSLTYCRCYYIIFYKLDIPHVSFLGFSNPMMYRASLPSVSPWAMGPSYTANMNFWQRLRNIWKLLQWNVFTDTPFTSNALVKQYVPERPQVTINELALQTLICFIDSDPILDYPRATAANEVLIGGQTTKPAKPLPKDLQDFMDSATDGAIIMSFGSFAPDVHYSKFLEAFRQIKQKVIWRYFKGDLPKDIPPNVRMMKWIPQNDLLGHKNTKISLTHCGTNGQFESLYHAVPMIAVPISGEQYYNKGRLEYHGYGIALNIHEFLPQDLIDAINTILTNDTFKNNIVRASKIYKSAARGPIDKAVYWTDHVLEFGGKHLHSVALDVPWYQFLMLDILLFVVIVSIIICYIQIQIFSYVLFKVLRK